MLKWKCVQLAIAVFVIPCYSQNKTLTGTYILKLHFNKIIYLLWVRYEMYRFVFHHYKSIPSCAASIALIFISNSFLTASGTSVLAFGVTSAINCSTLMLLPFSLTFSLTIKRTSSLQPHSAKRLQSKSFNLEHKNKLVGLFRTVANYKLTSICRHLK